MIERLLSMPMTHAMEYATRARAVNSLGDDAIQAAVARAKPAESRLLTVSDGLGLVRISGALGPRRNLMMAVFGGTSYLEIQQAIIEAESRDDVSRVMFSINSPGGSVVKLDETATAIRRMSKPTVAYIDGYAFSAGYYLASQAGRVVMGPSDETGSIGTVVVLVDESEALAKAGLSVVPVASDDAKKMGWDGSVTDDYVARVQADVDYFAGEFFRAVGRGRGARFSADAAREFGGNTAIGPAAVDAGLVDDLATFASVVGSEYEVIHRADRARGLRRKNALMRLRSAIE